MSIHSLRAGKIPLLNYCLLDSEIFSIRPFQLKNDYRFELQGWKTCIFQFPWKMNMRLDPIQKNIHYRENIMKDISEKKATPRSVPGYGALDIKTLSVLAAAHSPNTVRAYKADWAKFVAWGGSCSATPEDIANFMVAVADDGYKVSSIIRCLYAISHIHKAQGLPNPIADELVKQVRSGLRKTYGQPPAQAMPIETQHIISICNALDDSNLIDVRDRALITLGFFGAFRRSELVSLTCDQLHPVPQGVEVHLYRSKTNKFGEREIKPLVRATNTAICPITSMETWLRASGITDGAIFRNVTNKGVGADRPISAQTLYNLLKARADAAGIDPDAISPHGLRSGFVTSAYKAGHDRFRIKQVTGHKSDAVMDGYIRDADIFSQCAGRLG